VYLCCVSCGVSMSVGLLNRRTTGGVGVWKDNKPIKIYVKETGHECLEWR
jgi:hypothetical protein